MDNMLMKLMFAEIVILNVKLAQLMPSVLNVLMTLIESIHLNVCVLMDIMKTEQPSVQNVTTDVLLVPLTNNVSHVLNSELTHLNVTAKKVCSTSTEFVLIVPTDVTDVTHPAPTVKNVPKTELTPQPVIVQLCTMMIPTVLYVMNVTVDVILVILMVV